MANHSPEPDNYIEKKTFIEALEGADGSTPSAKEKADDAAKRKADKGEAAKNGGGDK